ncbi:gp424 [Bacillus phage G]|uniref:Gp424 n=1 Tax=Bacillus phage G TaxID=2884420 RepID=G3MAG5_9CAUD|nr:gp424 [Bacillus phage G]AEO93682.1 gp424 [Bacillus phage G]
MVKYYYDKYASISTTKYVEPAWINMNATGSTVAFTLKPKSYSFNSTTGKFSLSTDTWGQAEETIQVGQTCYGYASGELYEYTAIQSASSGSVPISLYKKREIDTTTQTTYSKGALLQSNIVAEDGTYPVNGRHTDGYWYVRGSIANTAPTVPGVFVYPEGSLEVGDSKVVSWGASTDIDGNLSKYILEVSIDSGTWTQIGTPTTNTFNYTIPTAVNIKFRVKAQDNDGLESGYRESSVFTVQTLNSNMVIDKPYLVDGNGGRKLVLLENEALVLGLRDSTNNRVYCYKSVDKGLTWSKIFDRGIVSKDISLTTQGNFIHLLIAESTTVSYYKLNELGEVISSNLSIDTGQIAISNISLIINPANGYLHAVWASKDSTYSNSYNLRYANSTDGGSTWSSVEQITKINNTTYHFESPSIAIHQNEPLIVCQTKGFYLNGSVVGSGNSYGILLLSKNASLTTDTSSNINLPWKHKLIYGVDSYVQSNPSVVTSKEGVIHVTWTGADSAFPSIQNLRYNWSTDGGVTWKSQVTNKITNETTKNQLYPSITIDKTETARIVWQSENGVNQYTLRQLKMLNGQGELDKPANIKTVIGVSPATLYDPSLLGKFGDVPFTVFNKTSNDSKLLSVDCIGEYTINKAPTKPGAFTQPTETILEIGDSKIISWGASTDENGNLSNYVLEASINNGAWIQMGAPTTNTLTLTIPSVPSGASAKFRVKAVDTEGLTSEYTESSVFTVVVPTYYWSKYSVIEERPLIMSMYSYTPWDNETTLAISNYEGRLYSSYIVEDKKFKLVSLVSSIASLTVGTFVYLDAGNDRISSLYVAYNDGFNIAFSDTVYELVEGDLVYKKGDLLQSDIVGVYNAYTNNARNSDGFWYVRGASTKITTPGAFTQPTGTLEIGDSKIISWGVSSGVFSKYILEVSINNGNWTKIAEPTSNSYTYVIPTSVSLKFRVKAVGATNIESEYVESSIFTAQPPQYYYDKFASISNTQYVDNAPWEYLGPGRAWYSATYTSYGIDSNGKYYNSGTLWGGPVSSGSMSYITGGAGNNSTVTRYTALESTPNPVMEIAIDVHIKRASNITQTTTWSKGSLMQTGIIGSATSYPTNGRHTDGYWYVRGLRVSQSIAPPGIFNIASDKGKFLPNEVVNISFDSSSASNISIYEVDYRYNENSWIPLDYNNTLARTLTTTTDKSLKTLQFRVRVKDKNNVYSDYVYSDIFKIDHNTAPVITITSPTNDITLYENDFLNVVGTINDIDQDQNLIIYCQVNNQEKHIIFEKQSSTQAQFAKQLKFTNGKLHNEDIEISDALSEDLLHSIKIWVEDSEGGKSNIETRSFYVELNHIPLISINEIIPNGIIDSDKFIISGTTSDQDEDSIIKVTYKINNGIITEIYSGAGGNWQFEVSLVQLKVGENRITVEATDNYNAKSVKIIKLNKNEINKPILESIARYKIEPPKEVVKGVLLFIQRDEQLDIKVEISMNMLNEQENFIELNPENSAPMPNKIGIIEDTFHHEVLENKENIILKITALRQNVDDNYKIHLISGVVE